MILAGGSDVLMTRDGDVFHPGDEIEVNYPYFTENADGDTAVIVSTNGEYSYVGRLVVSFDENGKLINGVNKVYDESGAYATIKEVLCLIFYYIIHISIQVLFNKVKFYNFSHHAITTQISPCMESEGNRFIFY